MKTALITGISGQGGAHLASCLLAEDYQVVGTTRDVRQLDDNNLVKLGIRDSISIKSLDLQNAQLVLDTVDQMRPDEIYHLAAPSSVARSFHEPAETIYSIALTTVNLLDAVRKTDANTPCFIATSTEMFGNCESPATANTPHDPKSPYGIGKSCAHYQARNYREAYGLFVCSGILSNFESPLRPRNYVTAKIISMACKIALGEASTIELGNLSIKRDWGAADEFMNAVRLTLQQPEPDDYLIATGTTSSLEEFLDLAFHQLGLDYRKHLVVKDSLLRPLDIRQTQCDPSVTEQKLGWKAQKNLQAVIYDMLYAELTQSVGAEKASSMLQSNRAKVVSLGNTDGSVWT